MSDVRVVCECGHPLSQHIPKESRPFDWPCSMCPCQIYREMKTLKDQGDGIKRESKWDRIRKGPPHHEKKRKES